MKDDETIENEFLVRNFDFFSQNINDIILSIFSFLRKLGLKSDFPDFLQERLKEEKGEEHLRKIEKRRIKAREEFLKSLILKNKTLKPLKIDLEDFTKTIKQGVIGLCKRAIEYLEKLTLMEEYYKTLNEDEKTIFKKINQILMNY